MQTLRATELALVADLIAVARALQRMRGDLISTGAWPHVAAACSELTKAQTRLLRGRGTGSTEEVCDE